MGPVNKNLLDPPNVSVTDLTIDEVLSYDYIEGTHEPGHLRQFLGIIKTLVSIYGDFTIFFVQSR